MNWIQLLKIVLQWLRYYLENPNNTFSSYNSSFFEVKNLKHFSLGIEQTNAIVSCSYFVIKKET